MPAWRLERHDTLPSTSDICIARAQAGAPGGLAVQARTQSRPRGTRGRGWSDPGGGLALSVLLRLDTTFPWAIIAGVAFHAALCLTPAHTRALRLKWPNDVMLADRKLGGILIEASPGPDGWLVIGFGANLVQAPALSERRAACLTELGPAPSADTMADRLLGKLARCCQLHGTQGHTSAEWLGRAHPVGTKLAIRTPEGQTTGSFSSIAEDGTLLLDVQGEIRRITTGEVLFFQGA